MIHTAGVYLLFGAVTLRALVVFANDPQLTLVMVLLSAYGLLFVAGPRIIRHRPSHIFFPTPSNGNATLLAKQSILPLAYLFLQTSLVAALLFIPATEDFFGNLFVLLSMDAVLYFGRRNGFLAIAVYSLIIVIALASSAQGLLFGFAMAFLYGGFGILLGGYAHQIQNAEAARYANSGLMEKLQEAHRQLQGFVTQAEEMAIEQERSRLARELHDSVTQTVFSMNLTAQSACLLLSRDPGRIAEQLERLEELAASVMSEIRILVLQLRPESDGGDGSGSIVRLGLPEALRQLAARRFAQNGLQVSIEVKGERDLAAPVAMGLFAVVQEALNNVARHTGTSQAFVRLLLGDRSACLEIEDHGPGFEPATASTKPGHFGLVGMADRVREIGWNLIIDSQPGRGTCIRVEEWPKEIVGEPVSAT